jgi:hypothetical protein
VSAIRQDRCGDPPRIVLVASISLYWVTAFVAWWASLWHAEMFNAFGADHPALTVRVIQGAEMGLPFYIAGLLSAFTLFLLFRKGKVTIVPATWLLIAATFGLALVLVALTLPMTRMCGEIVPGSVNSTLELSSLNVANECM